MRRTQCFFDRNTHTKVIAQKQKQTRTKEKQQQKQQQPQQQQQQQWQKIAKLFANSLRVSYTLKCTRHSSKPAIMINVFELCSSVRPKNNLWFFRKKSLCTGAIKVDSQSVLSVYVSRHLALTWFSLFPSSSSSFLMTVAVRIYSTNTIIFRFLLFAFSTISHSCGLLL